MRLLKKEFLLTLLLEILMFFFCRIMVDCPIKDLVYCDSAIFL
ncbi:hypothetical protein A1OE_731 [Candidatus Endolissoclinum faulkneri L2]|uniref:Uncharacterized protein n=1 Tax=Candidatus Endolissoclinum faulkneri L2 TaxID=1193729 RepID=K7Z4I6_9PROT|nr:hypothetical protein A1OE_731 [Candidatus Endolissoclinum faulkneri L2]